VSWTLRLGERERNLLRRRGPMGYILAARQVFMPESAKAKRSDEMREAMRWRASWTRITARSDFGPNTASCAPAYNDKANVCMDTRRPSSREDAERKLTNPDRLHKITSNRTNEDSAAAMRSPSVLSTFDAAHASG
jgi:hypothetical protein